MPWTETNAVKQRVNFTTLSVSWIQLGIQIEPNTPDNPQEGDRQERFLRTSRAARTEDAIDRLRALPRRWTRSLERIHIALWNRRGLYVAM